MKITFYLPSSLDQNKIGPILEQILLAQKNNVEISLLICGYGLKSCSVNQSKNYMICKACNNNMKRLFEQFKFLKSIKTSTISSFCSSTMELEEQVKSFTLKDFQNLSWDNKKLDVGWAIVSTFVSSTRNISNNISKKNRKRLFQNYRDSITLYEGIKNYISQKNPDEFVIFNGRLFDSRPVLRACQKANINCKVLEIGGYKLNNWLFFNNTLPHDLTEYSKKVEETWKNEKDNNKKYRIGEEFFKLRSEGAATNDKGYTINQNLEELPLNFNSSKKNIIIFNSSEDEIFSIGKDWNKIFDTQDKGVKYICRLLQNHSNYHIYLRIHPNLSKVKADFVIDLMNIDKEYNNITIIPPESTISSYQLLFNADKVITFGSTLGIEATYWDIPSLSLSSCFYLGINGAYSLTSKNDSFLTEFLFEEIVPKPKKNAIKYGFYQMTVGYSFKYWKNRSFNNIQIPTPTILEKLKYHAYALLK